MMTRHLSLILGAFVLFAFAAPALHAQPVAIPDALVTQQSIDDAGRNTITQYVRRWLPDLDSGDVRARESARDQLLAPLRRPNVTPTRAFRRDYDRAFSGRIEELSRSSEIGVAIAALQIAGALGSQSGYDALMAGLRDERAGVRYVSARGLGRLMSDFDAGTAIIAGQAVTNAVDAMRQRLAAEEEIHVVLGMVEALSAPAGGTREAALTAMARGLSEQMKARRSQDELTGKVIEVALIAVTRLRDEIIKKGGRQLEPEFAKQSALLAGQALATTLAVLEAGNDGGGDIDMNEVQALAISSEAVVTFAHLSLTNENVPARIEREIGVALEGRPSGFRDAVMAWAGANGRLTRQPYGVQAGDFR
ncbi:MAG: hypothetical protein VYC34_12515 [Planctomycetota bacterium]|nr:hypothetical protein [Planctomycetota bacterium]